MIFLSSDGRNTADKRHLFVLLKKLLHDNSNDINDNVVQSLRLSTIADVVGGERGGSGGRNGTHQVD